MKLSDLSVHAWIVEQNLLTENGTPVDFRNHLFLFEPYRDLSPKQVIFKAAQIGFSTLAINKSLWIAKKRGLNIIYTLPTQDDVKDFVGGKVNRIIAQNPQLQEWVKDKDSIEQKAVGDSIIYYRGTFTQKAAIMVSSDLNIYDEVDSSNQNVVEQYSTRLQHSAYKWEWYFSHPSAEGTGVDRYWARSDQKHWFVQCPSCNHEQFLSWPDSISREREAFVCKDCGKEITDQARRKGRWVQKYRDREFSGYWIPLLICPWVSAKEILAYQKDKSEEYFYNKVLGLPFVGGGNKLTKALLMRNLTDTLITPEQNERVVIGVDTGARIHLVAGTSKGLFYYSETSDYDELTRLLKRWPRAICVIDQGGDLIGSRQIREDFPGRVFLCFYKEADGKTLDPVTWGSKDEDGKVMADRNRMIQMVVDEFSDGRIPLQGKENDWYDYWLHWNALTRIKEQNDRGFLKQYWVRNGADHWAHATVYWRIGMSRFGGDVQITGAKTDFAKESPVIDIDNTVSYNPLTVNRQPKPKDWRKVA